MLKRIRELLGKRKKPTAEAPAETGAGGGPVPSGAAAATLPEDALARPPVHHGPSLVRRPIPQSDLDPDAVKIVKRLTRFDHKAYFVGGCVRDLLLERRPKDFDVGTSATPRQIKRLFRNCRIIGRRFRLAHIYFQNGKIIEVATFRARDEDVDGEEAEADVLIRDDNVFGTPEEDALRRDFTINSLFYDLNERNVIDHTDGLGDLRRRLVRTIGDPGIRFREDPVRILRAIKFAARLEFTIEPGTMEALRQKRLEIRKAASPRILEEINRFGREGAARRSYELLRETDVLGVILPEVAADCAGKPEAWELLLDLLGYTDRHRHGDKRPIRTGETFATLLLPMLTGRFGWSADGAAEVPRGVDPREIVDDLLRPIALRLRVPRREQEYCRQLLTTLFRMVPAARVRSSTKRAIRSRECLPDAQWMLEVLARRLGGDFAAASELWRGDLATPSSPDVREPAEERPRRRRRRRGSRGRGQTTPGEAATPDAKPQARPDAKSDSAPDRAEAADMPSPWDDDYFFAALPTAPEDGGETRKPEAGDEPQDAGESGDRRVHEDRREPDGTIDSETPGETVPRGETDDAPAAPRRRRRRRRRGRRPGSSDASAEDSTRNEAAEGGNDESESES